MDAMQILVIILSIFLALFLILAMVLIVLLIRVTRQIKTVTSTAKTAAERINDIASTVNKVTTPAVVGKLVRDYFKKAKRKVKED